MSPTNHGSPAGKFPVAAPAPDDMSAQLAIMVRGGQPPACNLCQDIGLVYDASVRRDDFGGYVLCECQKRISKCDGRAPFEYYDPATRSMRPCPSRPARVALGKVQRLERQSDIPRRYRGKFLRDILIDEEDIHFAIDFAFDLIRTFQSNQTPIGLYLYGGTGSGKTLLSCAILNELVRLYQTRVRYAKISRDILGRLRASFNPNSEFYGEGRQIEQQLATVPALVIDDFGVHKETEWVNSVLYDLIDARYENNLLTILTSNEPMDSWKEISGGRVYSRLREVCREHKIEAPDYRVRLSEAREKGQVLPE